MRGLLASGERGGVILFRRNLDGRLPQVTELTRAVREACAPDLPPLIGVDQEGGRVVRLLAPVLRLPPMRIIGAHGSARLAHEAARALGRELEALGFNMDFAPVFDVDTCAENPIIGDRSFSSDATVVASMASAFARGLQDSCVMACGKHFPGHGDTTTDSHLDLPIVTQPKERLLAVELAPFRGLRSVNCAALMTAHVVYTSLDPDRPATLSARIATDLLRGELGYDGVLISDDLEMKAIADRYPIEQAAVLAVEAGCDALLICSSLELQRRAHEALVREAEQRPAFRARVGEAARRFLAARRARPPAPADDETLRDIVGGAASVAVAHELDGLARP